MDTPHIIDLLSTQLNYQVDKPIFYLLTYDHSVHMLYMLIPHHIKKALIILINSLNKYYISIIYTAYSLSNIVRITHNVKMISKDLKSIGGQGIG